MSGCGMNIRFDGKRAIVTGGGKGIGRCIALRLSELGAKVFALSRTESDLTSLKTESQSIETRCVDITQWDITRQTIEEIGPVDILVNNAGIAIPGSIIEATQTDIDNNIPAAPAYGVYISQLISLCEVFSRERVEVLDAQRQTIQYDINFKAVINISQVVVKGMISHGTCGSIVNISSIYGIMSSPGVTIYCTSKAALDMLTKSMACEFAPYKIRVNSCNPTGVLTPLMSENVWDTREKQDDFTSRIPLRRFAEMEEVANTTVFLLSDYASMITGVQLPVDGGHITHLANTCP